MFTIRFLLPTLLMVCIPNFASAQTEPARPIYVKEFQINRFVDATRFVQKAVMANTAEGHYILEFTARYGETRERWTVTYENDPAFDFVQRVQMNSDWRYTIKCAGMVNDPRLTISVPGLTAELSLLSATTDSDLPLFRLNVIQTDNDRTIACCIVQKRLIYCLTLCVCAEEEEEEENCRDNAFQHYMTEIQACLDSIESL